MEVFETSHRDKSKHRPAFVQYDQDLLSMAYIDENEANAILKQYEDSFKEL